MKLTCCIAIAIVFGVASAGQAQLIGDQAGSNAQASWNTASAGTMAQRAPGRLVSRARANFREAHAQTITRSRRGPVIDEAESTSPSPEQQVLIDVIETSFDSLNAALLVLLNSIRAGGGLTPVLPGATDLTDLLGQITQSP